MTRSASSGLRRRFVLVLWLSIALHAAMIGFTRLPPPVSVPLPPEIQVRLAERVRPAPLPVAPAHPQPAKPTKTSGPTSLAAPMKTPSQPEAQPAPLPTAPAVSHVPEQTASLTAQPRATPGAEVKIPLLADTRFYTAKELDVQPAALRKLDPVYPARAGENAVPGRVVIRLHLESDGSVSKTEVVSVSPGGVFGEMFRQSTLDAVMGMRFRPAQRNGQPVRAVVEIPVVFELGR